MGSHRTMNIVFGQISGTSFSVKESRASTGRFREFRSRDGRTIERWIELTWLAAVDMRKVLECGDRNGTTIYVDLSVVSRTEPSAVIRLHDL